MDETEENKNGVQDGADKNWQNQQNLQSGFWNDNIEESMIIDTGTQEPVFNIPLPAPTSTPTVTTVTTVTRATGPIAGEKSTIEDTTPKIDMSAEYGEVAGSSAPSAGAGVIEGKKQKIRKIYSRSKSEVWDIQIRNILREVTFDEEMIKLKNKHKIFKLVLISLFVLATFFAILTVGKFFPEPIAVILFMILTVATISLFVFVGGADQITNFADKLADTGTVAMFVFLGLTVLFLGGFGYITKLQQENNKKMFERYEKLIILGKSKVALEHINISKKKDETK